MILLQLGGSFLLGLMGTPHCLAMCGPIALANANALGRPSPEACSKRSVRRSLCVQAGRGLGYASLGLLAGATLPIAQTLTSADHLRLAAKILCGLSLLVVGLISSGLAAPIVRRLPRALDVSGWLGSHPKGSAGAARQSAWAQLTKGLVWALLPCGLIYAALGLALSAGSAPAGALVMVAFFVGTLPAMTFVLGALRTLEIRFSLPRIRLATGLLVALAGVVQLEAVASSLAAPSPPSPDGAPPCACHVGAAAEVSP